MAELILVRGLPGSGKSTLAKKLMSSSAFFSPTGNNRHLEADQYFIDADGNYNFDVTKLYLAHRWCQEQTRICLANNGVAFVSNTFTTTSELKPYFKIAKEFGIMPIVYLAQNQFKNVHDVPDETLKKMAERFQFDISSLFGE